jgi:hypothetical protein
MLMIIVVSYLLRISNKYRRELKRPAVSALRRAIAEVKQRWSVIERVTKNLLSRAPPCFGRHDPDAFAVISTYQPAPINTTCFIDIVLLYVFVNKIVAIIPT